MSAPADLALDRLPELEPPGDAWRRISGSARRERRQRRWRRAWPVVVAGGLTATAAALIVSMALAFFREPVLPASELLLVQSPEGELTELRNQSQALEQLLRGLPGGPELVRAQDAAATAALEDRIAQLDWALSRRQAQPAGDVDAHSLWQERVGLMGELVRARYTEAGVEAY